MRAGQIRFCRSGEAEEAANATETRSMHDLLIALAFVGMVIAPAIVAARSAAHPMDDGE
jgi:hypothetical protein